MGREERLAEGTGVRLRWGLPARAWQGCGGRGVPVRGSGWAGGERARKGAGGDVAAGYGLCGCREGRSRVPPGLARWRGAVGRAALGG
eukprot:4892962-Pleurochrysis_carterae.AAC.1